MNNGAALFQAILEDPGDTGLRLVYADWLEGHGDADRAEFIRVQCRLAEADEEDDAWPELKARERTLLAQHRTEWLGPLGEHQSAWDFRFGHGFVEHAHCKDFRVVTVERLSSLL